jgi:hypothetical protein
MDCRNKGFGDHPAMREIVCRDRVHDADTDPVTDQAANAGDVGFSFAREQPLNYLLRATELGR